MRKTLALLVVLGLMLIGLAAPAGADSEARPFRGAISGEVFWTPDGTCSFTGMRTNAAATGNATHMGKMTMESSHCTPPGLDYGVGDMVLTAANGDEIHLEYWGTCEPFVDLPVGDVLACTFDFDVVGGTGRFADAGGHANGFASILWLGFEVPVMPAWWSYEGEIGY